MLVAKRFHGGKVKGIAEGMGKHDRFGFWGKCRLQCGHVNVVLRDGHIHEHRHGAVLEHRGDRRRKAGGHGDDLVPTPYGTLPQQRGCQRRKCQKIRRGAGVDKGAVTHAEIRRQFLFKAVGVLAGGQPKVQHTVCQIHHFCAVIHTGGIGNAVAGLIVGRFVESVAVCRNAL